MNNEDNRPDTVTVAQWLAVTNAAGAMGTEIRRAINKHGAHQTPLNREMGNGEKLAILVEEVGEVARALTYDGGDTNNLRRELEQVAAMAILWRASL